MTSSQADIIESRMRHLNEYLADLREYRSAPWEKFQSDKILRRFIERTLHLAAECCIDIGNHIISINAFREPDGNRDIFRVLQEESVIGADLAERMKDVASFRNIIVQEYTRIDDSIIFGILKNRIDDLKEFGKAVKPWKAKNKSTADDS